MRKFLMPALFALASSAAAATPTIGLSISTLNNPFFVDLKSGAEAAAKGKANLIVLDAQNKPDKQVSDLEDLITRRVSVIVVNATDSDAIVPAIKKANAARIPVITVDRRVNGGQLAYHIASDNVAGGKLAAQYVSKLLGGKGNVVELQGIPGESGTRDRGAGFNSVVKTTPGLKVVAAQAADFDRAKGLTVMENILQAQPRIDAVFAHNDEMILGAMQAVKASGRKIILVGFDAIDDAVKAVKSGSINATVAQQPKLIGQMGITKALDLIRTGKVPAKTQNIVIPTKLIVK